MESRRFDAMVKPLDDPIQRSCDAINGETRDRPGRDDPQRRAFVRVIVPEVRLCTPRFDGKSAKDSHEDDETIGLEVGAGDDRHRHEPKNAKQEPVNVMPPCAVPIHIFEVFLGKRPPDVDDEKNGQQKPAQQNTAIAGPKAPDGGAKRGHEHGL